MADDADTAGYADGLKRSYTTAELAIRGVGRDSLHGRHDADHHPRLVAADAYDDAGREDEATLLRDTTQPVHVDKSGKVSAARWTTQPVVDIIREVMRHLQTWSNDTAEIANLDWALRPDGTVRITHFDGDDGAAEGYAEDDPDSDNNIIHVADLPNYVADHIDTEVNVADYGWNTDGFGTNYGTDDIVEAARHWHGGQRSPLYRLGNNGYIENEDVSAALRELRGVGEQHRDDQWHLLHDWLTEVQTAAEQEQQRQWDRYNKLLNILRNAPVTEPAPTTHPEGKAP